MRCNEQSKLNKGLGKTFSLLLCLSQQHSRYFSSLFLVSPLAFATQCTLSLQRWWMAQEEGVNAQQFLPAITCLSLGFFSSLCSFLECFAALCESYRACRPCQGAPALAWVTHGLKLPQTHTFCASFSVFSFLPLQVLQNTKPWNFSYFYFKFCFYRFSENMVIISICISTYNEWLEEPLWSSMNLY